MMGPGGVLNSVMRQISLRARPVVAMTRSSAGDKMALGHLRLEGRSNGDGDVCLPSPSSPPSSGEILVTIQDVLLRSSLSPTLKTKAVYQYSVVRASGK